jgi:parvulin-like peptidyl-prolyl isomerase
MHRFSKSARHSPRVLIGLAVASAVFELRPQLAKSEPPSSPASDSGETLATFDAGRITRADYEQVLAQKLPNELEKISKSGGREALLETLIRYDLLAQEAERRGYGKRLEVKLAMERAASDRMIESLVRVDPAKVPAKEIDRAYTERSREFLRPEMRRATQIRVATEAEATALATQLKGADREQYSKVAREKNTDPRTRNQGGELGYFDHESKTDSGRPTGVPLELVDATFKLHHVGEISKPIAQDGSWSVLMFTGQMPPFTKTRAQAEPELRVKQSMQLTVRALDNFVAELKAKYAPEIHSELVDAVVLPPAEPLDMPEGFAAAPPDPRAPHIMLDSDGI